MMPEEQLPPPPPDYQWEEYIRDWALRHVSRRGSVRGWVTRAGTRWNVGVFDASGAWRQTDCLYTEQEAINMLVAHILLGTTP